MNRRIILRLFLLQLFLLSGLQVYSQEDLYVDVSDQPLNEVLLQMRDLYGLQLSYNENELSKYRISLNSHFDNPSEALNFMIRDLPFRLRVSGDVFIIIPDKKKLNEDFLNLSGQIIESGTLEPLPFSQVQIDQQEIETDETGSFSYKADLDSLIHIRITHPGYYIYDTLINLGIDRNFVLVSPYMQYKKTQNNATEIEKSSHIGEKAGNMKVNANIARYLPGYGDNSVFNLLKLMPGIKAAGEQSTDLSVWGSNHGQSMVTFDEYTLFGMNNYNDNISVVNPLIVKNIEVFKGGYEAKYGNRVGGIVNINSKNGSLDKAGLSLNVNPTTLNAVAEIPLFERSSLLIAGRQTYYNLYDLDDFNIYAPTRSSTDIRTRRKTSLSDIDIYPKKYNFGDLNLKYSINFRNRDLFYISSYLGSDLFKLSTGLDLTRTIFNGAEIPFSIHLDNTQENIQRGISGFYSRNWGNSNRSKVILSYSDISTTISDEIYSENLNTGETYIRDVKEFRNGADEFSLRSENIINLQEGHQMEFGALIRSNTSHIQILSGVNIENNNRKLLKTNTQGIIYFQDELPLFGKLVLHSGLRLNIVSGTSILFPEPRLSASWKIDDMFRLNAAWGIYNQFVYMVDVVDPNKNIYSLWNTETSRNAIPHANHYTAGINFFKNDFTVNIDFYYKTIENLTRWVYLRTQPGLTEGYHLFRGDERISGLDFYLRKDFGANSVWAVYTLNKSLENYSTGYKPAPHDQIHEFKIASLYNIGKFCLSGNYLYGSGTTLLKEIYGEDNEQLRYKRLDLAIAYRINRKKVSGEVGLSLLNVFDRKNISRNNLRIIHISDQLENIRISTAAQAFTPLVFVKVSF